MRVRAVPFRNPGCRPWARARAWKVRVGDTLVAGLELTLLGAGVVLLLRLR